MLAGLPAGTHTVEIFRRTETDQGATRFLGVVLDDGKALVKPPKRKGK